MEIEILLSFLAASIILSFMPGPDNIFVITESLSTGHKNGVAISVGLASGVMIHTLAAATGLSIIIQQSALAFSIIKYLGATYMFYLAYTAIKEKPPVFNLDKPEIKKKKNTFQYIQTGFLMNILNPKVSLFFIAFLPQFISEGGFNIILQMIILGLIFMLQALIIFSLIAVLSGRLTKYLNSSKFWNITKWSKVSVLGLLGLTLVFAKAISPK